MQFGEIHKRNILRKGPQARWALRPRGRQQFFIVCGFSAGLMLLGFLIWRIQPQSIFLSASAPFHVALRSGVRSAGLFASGFFKNGAIVQELEKYRRENQLLYGRLVDFEEIKRENDFLRSALTLQDRYSFKTIPADIIAVNSNGFQETLAIQLERGEIQEDGATIISDTGLLIGRLDSSYGRISQIVLLSDPRMIFNARVVDSDAEGVVKGRGFNRMVFELVEKKFEIKEGDILYTSDLGGIFPSGIPFGKIKEVHDSDLAGFVSASVEGIADPRSFSKVLIIKGD